LFVAVLPATAVVVGFAGDPVHRVRSTRDAQPSRVLRRRARRLREADPDARVVEHRAHRGHLLVRARNEQVRAPLLARRLGIAPRDLVSDQLILRARTGEYDGECRLADQRIDGDRLRVRVLDRELERAGTEHRRLQPRE